MTKCALIVDIIIGELSILESSSIAQRVKNPLCPIVAIQISSGPLLYIPFLSPESIKSHLQYISDGHQFLPLEIEESYLNGGKFNFHRGKSCIYTIPHESVFSASDKWTTSSYLSKFISSQNIMVIVMNALVFPPSLFGKSKLQLQSENENEACIRGKVTLRNHNGMIVGNLTLSITLRNLGEDVAIHTKMKHIDKEENEHNEALYSLLMAHKESHETDPLEDQDKKDKPDRNKNFVSTTGSVGQNRKSVSEKVCEDHIEHSYEFSYLTKNMCNNEISHHESSEEIAARISALVEREEYHDLSSREITKPYMDRIDICSQPVPIFYNGRDLDSERLWNKKMQQFRGFHENQPEFHIEDEKHKQTGKQQADCVCSISDDAPSSSSNHAEPYFVNKSLNKATQITDLVSESPDHVEKTGKNNKWHTLKTPKGWLRSAPVASCNMQKPVVNPRLTRTSLLRRAKMDPQLAQQLKSEVNYQVKQKLNVLEKNFKDDLIGLKKRKLIKKRSSHSISVGCQAESDRQEKSIQLNNRYLHKDFTQQTVPSNTTNQATQISNMEKVENNLQVLEIERTSNKLEKNRTFEVDVPKFTHIHISQYEDDFEISTASNIDNKSISESERHQESLENSYTASKSQDASVLGNSLSMTEPKKYHTERRTTNITRETKMKLASNGKKIKENSEKSSKISSHTLLPSKHSDNQDFTIEEDITSKTFTSLKSEKVTSSVNYDESISELGPPSEDVTSEASEISEDSKLSKEVYQEIMKGKQADILLRNGSQMQFETWTHEPSIAEDVKSSNSSVSDSPQSGNVSQNQKSVRSKFILAGETFSIGEIVHSDIELHDPLQKESESSSQSQIQLKRKLYKGTKIRELYKTYTKSEPSILSLEKRGETQEIYENKSVKNPASILQGEGDDDDDSTISNISARIAALLMPKQLEVASLHTDSISSYMPSNVSDTLSSLSDME